MKIMIGPYPGQRSKKPRRISIRIDDYDLWNLDCTLALIIAPALKQLRDTTGMPGKYYAEKMGTSGFSSQQCFKFYDETPELFKQVHEEWLIEYDKMIWAFENYDDADFYEPETLARVQEGLDLFAKYYTSLWN